MPRHGCAARLPLPQIRLSDDDRGWWGVVSVRLVNQRKFQLAISRCLRCGQGGSYLAGSYRRRGAKGRRDSGQRGCARRSSHAPGGSVPGRASRNTCRRIAVRIGGHLGYRGCSFFPFERPFRPRNRPGPRRRWRHLVAYPHPMEESCLSTWTRHGEENSVPPIRRAPPVDRMPQRRRRAWNGNRLQPGSRPRVVSAEGAASSSGAGQMGRQAAHALSALAARSTA